MPWSFYNNIIIGKTHIKFYLELARRIKGDGQGKERSKISLYEFLNVAFLPLYLYAMELSFALRKGVEVRKIEAITNIQNCITASLFRTVKDSIRHDKYGYIQSSTVKCVKYFTINIGSEKTRHNPQGISTIYPVYFSRESLRNLA